MKHLLLFTFLLHFTSSIAFAAQGGSSTVGALGPTAYVAMAFDGDPEVREEIRALKAKGFRPLFSYPEMKLVNRKNCRTPEGPEYVGGKATFEICDLIFSVKRDYQKPGKAKVVTVSRLATYTVNGIAITKE